MGKSKAQQSPKMSDEQIIDLYLDRNEKAISETETKYGNMLFTIAYNILYDPQDCEECKNDAYLGIWNAIPPSRPVAFFVFISKIMRNIATDRYKEKIRKKRIPSEMTVSIEELQEILVSTSNVEIEYEAKEAGRIISEYVSSLTTMRRFIFIERFYLGLTSEQIAKEYGVSSATICRELKRIKQGLKSHLERNGVCL